MLVFTSCTVNYIPKARVLASSLKAFHPDWTFCLLLGEGAPEGFDVAREPFDRVVFFDQLGIPDYLAWLFRHRVVEICTAAKGPALQYFLEEEGHDKVMYLDPDIMVCNSLVSLETLLDTHDILLTPHLLAPQNTKKAIEDNEISTLQHGVFNLGFVAVAKRGQGLEFSRWWCNRLLNYCYDDIPRGLFTDQRWCDLAPAFFSKLHIIRDPGYNAASWNLTDRTITRSVDGTFMANDVPLRFYHFTGYDSGCGADMISYYAANMPSVFKLWELYAEKLHGFSHKELCKKKWRYAFFANNTPITDQMRLLYREHPQLQKTFPDPYAVPGYLNWYHDNQIAQRSPQQHRVMVLRKLISFLKAHLESDKGVDSGFWRLLKKATSMARRDGVREALRKAYSKIAGYSEPLVVAKCSMAQADVASRPSLEEILRSDCSMESVRPMLERGARPILVIEHDWGGGAACYLEERITDWQRESRAIFRLKYSFSTNKLEMVALYHGLQARCWVQHLRTFADPVFKSVEKIVVNELAGWYLDSSASTLTCKTVLQNVIQAVRDITWLAQQHDVSLQFLCHDFYAICPRVNCILEDGSYCAEDGLNGRFCDTCLKNDAISEWRDAWRDLLTVSQSVVFFSNNTRQLVETVYPLRSEQVSVRPHSIPKYFFHPISLPKHGPLRVAVVGNISRHKGAHMVRDMALLLKKCCPDAEVIVFGTLDIGSTPKNLRVLGSYSREELPFLLEREKITIAALVSVCPETFCYVAHELAALGVPLVSLPLGAQGEFVAQLGPKGLVAKDLTPKALVDALLELSQHNSACA